MDTKEVSKTFSTTQVAGALTIGLTIYNTVAQNAELQILSASPDQMMAIATLAAPAVTAIYMMWRRAKKSNLIWGFLK